MKEGKNPIVFPLQYVLKHCLRHWGSVYENLIILNSKLPED